jgi:DNA-directed RNA polymerase sigma subunit (sigma70/sigma32)
MRYSEIAKKLQLSVDQVKKIETKALKKLRRNPSLLKDFRDYSCPEESFSDTIERYW